MSASVRVCTGSCPPGEGVPRGKPVHVQHLALRRPLCGCGARGAARHQWLPSCGGVQLGVDGGGSAGPQRRHPGNRACVGGGVVPTHRDGPRDPTPLSPSPSPLHFPPCPLPGCGQCAKSGKRAAPLGTEKNPAFHRAVGAHVSGVGHVSPQGLCFYYFPYCLATSRVLGTRLAALTRPLPEVCVCMCCCCCWCCCDVRRATCGPRALLPRTTTGTRTTP